jgi:hypothetical protein
MKIPGSCLPALAACAALLHGCAGETPGSNRRPVAQAGCDRTAALSEPVVLDAGSSFDPDGDALSYNWDLVAAPRGGTADIVKPDKETAGLAPDALGVWVVRLTVSDGQLLSEPDVIRIRVGEQDHPHSFVCEGDTLVVYDWQGQELSRQQCDLGCNAAADPNRCNLVGTSNFDPKLLCANDHDLVLDSPATIDTTAGTITGIDPGTVAFYEIAQGAELPSIGVFVFNNIEIRADLIVRGQNALALVACKDMEIHAVIDASANGRIAGPGGFDGGEPGNNGQGPGYGLAAASGTPECPTLCAAGGGGGGHGGQGGQGGDLDCRIQSLGSIKLAPGSGGSINGGESLAPLWGGSGGGGGTLVPNTPGNSPGAGGGGGGAVQLSAGGHILITAGGGMTVAGEGGGRTLSGGGAGGGAGGAILIEAASIEIGSGAFLAANGGGGGGGDCLTKNDDAGLAGEKGTTNGNDAEGGEGSYPTSGDNAGDGGSGGAGGHPNGEDGDEDSEDWEGGASGGGGGACGRIRLNTLDMNASIHGVVSPANSDLLTQGQLEIR